MPFNATCSLVGCVPAAQFMRNDGRLVVAAGGRSFEFVLTDQEDAFGGYDEGRWAWLLADVRRLAAPIAATGALGLWEWDFPSESRAEL